MDEASTLSRKVKQSQRHLLIAVSEKRAILSQLIDMTVRRRRWHYLRIVRVLNRPVRAIATPLAPPIAGWAILGGIDRYSVASF
jgi:hypothetical protein